MEEKTEVLKGRLIYVELDSERLEAEREHIATTLESIGLKGLDRVTQFVMHMSLGDSRKGMSVTEQKHVKHVIDEAIEEVHPAAQPLIFEEWDVYPDLSHWLQ